MHIVGFGSTQWSSLNRIVQAVFLEIEFQILILIFFIQAEPYIGITPGCAASESGVTSPELLIMFPYDNLERF